MNTLIVDHKIESRQTLRGLLEDHGHSVMEAANGEEGLSATLEKRPDLIISDILMPRLDGFRFCQAVKNHRDFQHIPFIFYSAAFTDDEDRRLAGDIGADLFLEKPQEPTTLINSLQGVLSQPKYNEGEGKTTRSRALEQLTSRIDARLSQKLTEQQHEIEQHEALFQRLLLNLPGMVYRCRNDRDWSMLFVSHGSRRVTGYDPEAFTGQQSIPYADLIHPDDQEAVWNEVQAAVASAEPFSVSYRLRDAEGRERFVMEQGRGLIDKHGTPLLEGYIWDISAQKLAENQRRRFFNISLDLLLIADIHGYARQLSNSWQRALGWHLQELKLRPWMEFVHPDDRQATEHASIVLSQGRQVLSFENRLQCKDGSYRLFSWNAFSVREEGLLYGVARDITETRHYQVELEKRVNYDQLTGLPNRNLLRDRVEQALGYAQRQKSRAALLFLDLDGFREINEILGHEQGDQVLRTLAERFAGTLRKGDTVARWGGDEFIFVLTDIRERATVTGILEQLITQLNLPIRLPENQLFCDGSFGCSFYPDDGDDLELLLRHSEIAMYQAKQLMGSRYQFYEKALNDAARRKLKLQAALRDGLQRNEFSLHYQPQRDVDKERTTGIEALVRWSHPELGTISPAEFIPIAEQTGFIIPLGLWVLRQACGDYMEMYLQARSIRLAVNISYHQIEETDFVGKMQSILAETGMPPEMLELEITENVMLRGAEKVQQILQQIKALGISLCLDDFGTGYSSLSYLQQFPFDVLKIDQSFIARLTDSENQQALCQAIISMSHALGLGLVAEGVENSAQSELLSHMNCNLQQGYHYSRPLPRPELEALIASES